MHRTRTSLHRTVAALACVALLAGCAPRTAPKWPANRAPGPLNLSVAVAAAAPTDELARSVNAFGFDLLKAGKSTSAEPNVIVSPLSVADALSMTANGADGETLQQMRDVLHVSTQTPAATNASWASLLKALANRSPNQKLDIANSLWGDKSVHFKAPFLAEDRSYFGAELSTLDFMNPGAPAAINSWVSGSTHGMISSIVSTIPPGTIMYLVNAVYFKGEWAEPFNAPATRDEEFTLANGTSAKVPSMHDTRELRYAETPSYQAVALPYQGEDSSMYVILPKPGVSLDSAVAALSGTGFSAMKRAMEDTAAPEVEISLPKLDTTYSTTLSGTLKKLGMERAFDPNRAQFGNVAGLAQPVYIQDVAHATRLKLDEQGTEAAAATAVNGATLGLIMTKPIPMIVNHPYLLALVDNKSGALLFLGAINDPRR